MRSHPALNHFRHHVLCSALLVAAGVCGAIPNAHAQQTADKKSFDVPEQPAAKALNSFAEQADITLVFSQDLVQGVTVHPLHGTYTTLGGLQAMLEGTGLGIQKVNEHTISIGEGSHSSEPGEGESRREAVNTLAAVTVTGTRIRGGSTPSPVITIGSEQIQQEGFTDLGQVIRSVPQNFSGGQNPGLVGVTSGPSQDLTGGSALNLRGLGADASLTLLNGRRLAYDGSSQAVDISAIPTEAVERLEIVPDGASAIYGSDAVGGVANVILKRDYEGVTVGARYGGATDGGLGTREYTATAGTTWGSGGLIATFKDTEANPLYTRQRSYTRYLLDPYTIYNRSDSRSGLVSIHQSIGDAVELGLDTFKTNRDMTQYFGLTTDSYYRYRPEASITLVAPSIAFSLRNDWSLTLSGTYGKDDDVYARYRASTTGNSLDDLEHYNNESRSWEIDAEGPLFPVWGGDAHLAIGAGAREYEYHNVPKISGSPSGGDENVRFAYAELSVPFVSPASDIPGIHRLEFSAAMRGEDYDSFGRVTTPKFGLIYDPTADFTFKTSWGRSFKAPTLSQLYGNKYAYLWSASGVGASGSPADATVLMSYGGNADLQPERARTWTASLGLHPEALPGLDAELTWFDIGYTNRVTLPLNYMQALSNPAYAAYVDRSPTPEQIRELFAVYGGNFYNLSGMAYDPGQVMAIIRDQYVNAARQRIKGIDLSGSYRLDLGRGQLTVRGSASWLDSAQTTIAGQPEQTLAGTVFNPARLNGRIGAIWSSGGFSASGFVNYTGGVTNRLATMTEKGASFTTLDTTFNYELGERAGTFSGLTFALSVQNLLNRAPPLYTSAFADYIPYDATNYTAIGRFVSISVSKHW
jgi:outer membrane receptor protein involved in Fe transport